MDGSVLKAVPLTLCHCVELDFLTAMFAIGQQAVPDLSAGLAFVIERSAAGWTRIGSLLGPLGFLSGNHDTLFLQVSNDSQ
jgi:hypothetical protein